MTFPCPTLPPRPQSTPPATRQFPGPKASAIIAPLPFPSTVSASTNNTNVPHLASSSVSSPSAHDVSDLTEVDELLEGIDRVRIDDLWITPRSAAPSPSAAPLFREGLFAPPQGSGIAAITTANPNNTSTGFRSKPLKDILDAAAKATEANYPDNTTTTSNNTNLHQVSSNNNTSNTAGKRADINLPLTLRSKSIRATTTNFDDADLLPRAASYARTLSAPAIRSPTTKDNRSVAHTTNITTTCCDHAHDNNQRMRAHTSSSCLVTDITSNNISIMRVEPPSGNNNNNDTSSTSLVNPSTDFPTLFKVYPCPTAAECYARGDHAECFYYHAVETDRRRPDTSRYRPHMCRFIEEVGGCRKGDRCPFAHNDFERRYHPDRFGKETCRDFLRGDCPRLYCTFRHEVSSKVEISLQQIDAMSDKEVLQLVLKISDAKGRALSEKLVRRFGHGKKHSGWRLEGFNPRGRDDQKVKFVTIRVEEVKRRLKAAGERKWASSLKTSSLRDMMSGVRKVAEEIRERHYRSDDAKLEAGPEMQRLIRGVFSNTNWSCHSQEGDNPFIVTPDNQNDAMDALERLVAQALALARR